MARKKISKKQGAFFEEMPIVKVKNLEKFPVFNPEKNLKNKKYISKALWGCLIEDDVEAFKEILKAHLELTNKEELARETGISRRTLFRMLSPEGNPRLDNLAKIINKVCA